MAEQEPEPYSDNVVFAGIREDGRSFGQHLKFLVYTLRVDGLPRRVEISSFVHSVANMLFEKTGVPTGAYVDYSPTLQASKTPYIISTAPLPIPSGEVRLRAVDHVVTAEIFETGLKATLINLYSLGHRFAVQTLWSRILQQSMRITPGFRYEYDVVHHGIKVRIDKHLLKKHLPDWADELVRRNALDVSDVSEDALSMLRLKNRDFCLFEPERYVDIDPRVGIDGTAYALTPVRTRMECPTELNLRFLKQGLPDAIKEWRRPYNFTKVYFRMEWQGRRLKPNSVHLESVLPKAGDVEVQLAKEFFTEQGFAITQQLDRLIDESREQELAIVRPHFLSEDYRKNVSYVVPLKVLVPIITQENMRLFSKLITLENTGTEKLSKIYQTLTKFNTEATACFNHAVANAITKELRPTLAWEDGQKLINFIPGPIVFKPSSEKHAFSGGFYAFGLTRPRVAVLNRETGMLEWVDPSGLYYFSIGELDFDEPLQILSKPDKFDQKMEVALVHPEYRTSYRQIKTELACSRGPNICEGIMNGDFKLLDPTGSRHRWNKSPLKFLDEKMPRMYSFFGYEPAGIKVEHYTVDDLGVDDQGVALGYINKMKDALRHGVDLFVIFLPNTPIKYIRDAVYYSTYAFAFQHGKPVMHYRAGTWKGFTELYGLAYSHLATMARRFGGEIFKVDAQELWGRIKKTDEPYSIQNPLCVYVDFAPWHGQSVGLITSTRADFSKTYCHITFPGTSQDDIFNNIETVLKDLLKKGHHDFLLTLRDSYLRETEIKRIEDVADEAGIPSLPISTIKGGGLSAWKFRKPYRRNGLTVTAPLGVGLSAPDDTVELFPHNIELERMVSGGLWRSIRLKKEQPYPATIRIDDMWIASLGMILASTAGYLPFPTRMKYPEFLVKAERLAELVENSVFQETVSPNDSRSGVLIQFNANLID
jgi:hypothetical protein